MLLANFWMDVFWGNVNFQSFAGITILFIKPFQKRHSSIIIHLFIIHFIIQLFNFSSFIIYTVHIYNTHRKDQCVASSKLNAQCTYVHISAIYLEIIHSDINLIFKTYTFPRIIELKLRIIPCAVKEITMQIKSESTI